MKAAFSVIGFLALLLGVQFGCSALLDKVKAKDKAPHYNYSFFIDKDSAKVGDVFVITRIDTTKPDQDIPTGSIEIRLSPQPTTQSAR